MTEEQQLKLQAFFDGELPETEARDVAAWVARDAEATALMTELRHTRQALTDFERTVKLPEAPEFFWSKIRREIERREPVVERAPQPAPFMARLRRLLMPAGAFAVLMIAGLVAVRQFSVSSVPVATGTEVAMTDSGTDAFTYRDEAEGTTLVWLSDSGENKFTDAGSRDTLQQQ